MNKKLLLALTLLAVVLSGTALGLWWTVKGKTEATLKSSAMLSPRFGTAEFNSRLSAIGKAHAALVDSEALAAKQKDELEVNGRTIEQANKKIKDLDANVSELDAQRSELTRVKGELEGKAESLQSKANAAEAKVKDLEDQIVKTSEENQQKIEELQSKVDGDKATFQADAQKARGFYSGLYNFVRAKGLNLPADTFPEKPWETGAAKQTGPRFAANSLVAEIVAIDTRLGFVVLNVGGDAGLLRDQGFDILVNDQPVGKMRIGDILNSSVSSGYLLKGTDAKQFSAGSVIKLIPLGSGF